MLRLLLWVLCTLKVQFLALLFLIWCSKIAEELLVHIMLEMEIIIELKVMTESAFKLVLKNMFSEGGHPDSSLAWVVASLSWVVASLAWVVASLA